MKNNEKLLEEIIEYLLEALEEEHIGLREIYRNLIKEKYGVEV